MKSQALRIGAVFILAIIVFIGGWTLLYPSPDRRNIKYVLWKAGLYRMNLGQAEGIMILDPGRDDLVVGKTRAEIERRFGRLSPLSDASEYAKFCCAHGAACGN